MLTEEHKPLRIMQYFNRILKCQYLSDNGNPVATLWTNIPAPFAAAKDTARPQRGLQACRFQQ